jgi:hypothetical protein
MQHVEEYREKVEGGMGSLVDLLYWRSNLLHLTLSEYAQKIMRQEIKYLDKEAVASLYNDLGMILGGDKYLKKWMDAEVHVADTGLVQIRNADRELINFVYSEMDHVDEHLDTTDEFEMVVFSLTQIYDLPEWIRECGFWVQEYKEGDAIEFDLGAKSTDLDHEPGYVKFDKYKDFVDWACEGWDTYMDFVDSTGVTWQQLKGVEFQVIHNRVYFKE